MKRTLQSLILFLCLLAPFAINFSILQIHKLQFEQELTSIIKLNSKPQIKFHFSNLQVNREIHWEKSDEFMFKGEMYDVISKNINNDSIEIVCLADDDEDLINDILFAEIENDIEFEKNQKNRKVALLKFFNSLYCNDLPFYYMIHYGNFNEKQFPKFHNLSFGHKLPPTTPPPKKVIEC